MQISRFDFRSLRAEEAVPPRVAEEIPEQETVETEPPAPVFSQDDLAAADMTGYDRGFTEGFQAAKTQARNEDVLREEQMVATLQSLCGLMQQAAQEQRDFLGNQQETLAQLALAIARKIAGDACQQYPLTEIERMVQECLLMQYGETKIIVTVHASLVTPLRRRIDDMVQSMNFAGEVVVQGESAIGAQDCRIEWAQGKAERNTEKIWQEIARILAQRTPAQGEASNSGGRVYLAN